MSLVIEGAARTRTQVFATAYSQTPVSGTATVGGGEGRNVLVIATLAVGDGSGGVFGAAVGTTGADAAATDSLATAGGAGTGVGLAPDGAVFMVVSGADDVVSLATRTESATGVDSAGASAVVAPFVCSVRREIA